MRGTILEDFADTHPSTPSAIRPLTTVPPRLWWPNENKTESPWYKETIGHRLSPGTEKFYTSYAGLSGDELISHLYSIVCTVHSFSPCDDGWTIAFLAVSIKRDRAWPLGKYPRLSYYFKDMRDY